MIIESDNAEGTTCLREEKSAAPAGYSAEGIYAAGDRPKRAIRDGGGPCCQTLGDEDNNGVTGRVVHRRWNLYQISAFPIVG